MKDRSLLENNGINVEASLDILGDMEMYDETLVDFLDEVDEKIEKLNEYNASHDMANYAIIAHSLKSDSKYLGFTKLAELALDNELKGKENDSEYVSLHFDEFMNEAARIIKVVREYMGK